MTKLTPKQEKFCSQYVLLGHASDAYRSAYNASKMTSKSVNEKASQMLKQVKIRSRVAELQEESKKEFCVSAEEKRKMLWELAITCAQTDEESKKIKNPTAVISAIAEMNKMDGDLATIKTENTNDTTIRNEWHIHPTSAKTNDE